MESEIAYLTLLLRAFSQMLLPLYGATVINGANHANLARFFIILLLSPLLHFIYEH